MSTVSTPVLAYVATILALASGGVNQSSTVIATVNFNTAWEGQVPVQIRYSNVSADAVIYVYPSNDGGVTYDTDPMTSFSIPRAQGTSRQVSIRLPSGQYQLALVNSGPNSASFAVLTQQILTAVINV